MARPHEHVHVRTNLRCCNLSECARDLFGRFWKEANFLDRPKHLGTALFTFLDESFAVLDMVVGLLDQKPAFGPPSLVATALRWRLLERTFLARDGIWCLFRFGDIVRNRILVKTRDPTKSANQHEVLENNILLLKNTALSQPIRRFQPDLGVSKTGLWTQHGFWFGFLQNHPNAYCASKEHTNP